MLVGGAFVGVRYAAGGSPGVPFALSPELVGRAASVGGAGPASGWAWPGELAGVLVDVQPAPWATASAKRPDENVNVAIRRTVFTGASPCGGPGPADLA
jgi:hypothetical protein